jgi:threonylcarbamoyladenosine tRNA methylthiotransferase MtaB
VSEPGGITFAAEFLGCKVSLCDAQAVRERLIADGHREVEGGADVRVVNTCCVTAEAVAKSRKAVRRAARSAGRVVVTGCAANLDPAALGQLPENVTVVRERSERTPQLVSEWVGGLGCAGGRPPAFARTRAYLRIQDGCSFRCSYCVIPLVRGRSRSRSAPAVLGEAARRAGQGHREIVLTGINLGCFRDREAGIGLAELLHRCAEVPGIERVRLSSIEVNHLGPRLLEAIAGHPRIAPHLHVPLQSGSGRVLAAMRRHYTVATFLSRIDRARERVAGLNLTTDVIVGHPAEDDAAYEETLAVVRRAGFSHVHVFPYSPRPGTADADSDRHPPAVARRRVDRLVELSAELSGSHRRSLLGSRARVLVETAAGTGRAADYTAFLVPGGVPGRMHDVIATGVRGDRIVGEAA